MAPLQDRAAQRLAWWIFLSFLFFYLTLTRGHFWSTDEVAVYQQTRSLWERGDLSTGGIPFALPGAAGRRYVPYGAGQSLLALPLYAAGKQIRLALEAAGAGSWLQTFAGRYLVVGTDQVWGGEVEIFFVNLLNAFTVAALCALFYAFSLRLGAPPRSALAAAALLGTASYVAGFGTSFFQQPGDVLFLFATFYFLFRDAREPSARLRLCAGTAAGMLLLVRISSAIALPVLCAYLLWNIFRRSGNADWRFLVRTFTAQSLPFALPVAAGLALTGVVNYWKFGSFSITGTYSLFVPMDQSLLVSLYGFLFSPGASIFLFTPLLLLAPWYFRGFFARCKPETLVILALTLAYLIFYGKSRYWHSQWAFGSRYTVPFVPLLLLPLGPWIAAAGRRARAAVLVLAALGIGIQLLHLLVNVSYVYYHERYAEFQPPYGFLFIPEASQIPAHLRALLAWDERVDFWLLNVYRQFGLVRTLTVALPLLTGLALSSFPLVRILISPPTAPPGPEQPGEL